MKKVILGFVMMAAVTLAKAGILEGEQPTLKEAAIIAAISDSATTLISGHAGGIERNPLVNTSATGLIALAVVKWGMVELVESSSLSSNDKKSFMKTATSAWTGVSVNNILIALSVTNPVALVAGVAAGIYMWNQNYADEPKNMTASE